MYLIEHSLTTTRTINNNILYLLNVLNLYSISKDIIILFSIKFQNVKIKMLLKLFFKFKTIRPWFRLDTYNYKAIT